MARRILVISKDNDVNPLENPYEGWSIGRVSTQKGEFERQITALNNQLERVKFLHKMLAQTETKLRREVGQNIEITDHAIVRYLERYTDIDLEAVEDALIDMVENRRPEVMTKAGMIITVLPQGQSATGIVDRESMDEILQTLRRKTPSPAGSEQAA